MFVKRWLAIIALVLCASSTAAAQESPSTSSTATEDPRARGVRLFREAADHYRAGRFRVAVELLRESYELHPEPVVLFNLARSLEGLGEFDAALDAYRRFLEASPDAPDRGAVEARVETLTRLVEEQQARAEAEAEAARASAEAAETPEVVAPPAGPDELDVGSFVFIGAGAAGLITGAILSGVAVTTHNDWVNAPSQEAALSSLASAQDLALAANVAFIAGGVLAMVGGIWLIVDASDGPAGAPSESVTAQLGVGPGSAELTLRW